MDPVQVLKAGKEALEKPGGWTQGTYARDAEGKSTPPQYVGACSFCSVGILMFLLRDEHSESTLINQCRRYLDYAVAHTIGHKQGWTLVVFNDEHNQEEVLKMWGVAIELALLEQRMKGI